MLDVTLKDRIKYENIWGKLELCKWNVYTKTSVETTVQQVSFILLNSRILIEIVMLWKCDSD